MQATAREGLAAVLALALIALLAGLAGYLSVSPEEEAPAEAQAGAPPSLRGSLRGFSGDSLSLSTEAGPLDVRLAADARIEVLRPASSAELRPGDWLNAGAVPHDQTVFALIGLILIAQDQLREP